MQPSTRTILLYPVLLFLAACAGTAPAHEGPSSPRTDRNVITREQLLNFRDAYDAVEALRSNWLRPRSADSSSPVWVYLESNRLGEVETLRNMNPVDIESIRFFNASEAQSRWGVGHNAGVILVSRRVR